MQKPREQSPWSPDITDQASSPSQPQKLPAGAAAHDIDIPTPPSTEDDQLEPTPNRIPSQHVRDVLRAIRLRQQGRKWASSSAWQRFSLTDSEYEQVQKILRDEEPDLNAYVQDKLRCDYFHSAQYLVLRMPSALHDIFIRFVAADIKEQLKAIAASASPSAEFAKDILDCSTTKIVPLDTNYKSHEPDASFKHVDAALPGVVLEVSYTQKRKDLPRLVDDYILGSDLNVQLVVGLDIEYRGKEAVLSMWRPGRQADAEDQEAEYGFAENFVVDQVGIISHLRLLSCSYHA